MLTCQVTTLHYTHTHSNDRDQMLLTSYLHFMLIYILQVIRLFNLFITYGDTFLPCPTTYDELYYELIRLRHLFDSLYQLGTVHHITPTFTVFVAI